MTREISLNNLKKLQHSPAFVNQTLLGERPNPVRSDSILLPPPPNPVDSTSPRDFGNLRRMPRLPVLHFHETSPIPRRLRIRRPRQFPARCWRRQGFREEAESHHRSLRRTELPHPRLLSRHARARAGADVGTQGGLRDPAHRRARQGGNALHQVLRRHSGLLPFPLVISLRSVSPEDAGYQQPVTPENGTSMARANRSGSRSGSSVSRTTATCSIAVTGSSSS